MSFFIEFFVNDVRASGGEFISLVFTFVELNNSKI